MDNDDLNIPPKSFHRYLEKQDFTAFCGKVDTRFNKMEVTFHGADGTSGLIAEVNTIKTKLEVAEGLIKWVFGASAVGTLLTIVNLLKQFNFI